MNSYQSCEYGAREMNADPVRLMDRGESLGIFGAGIGVAALPALLRPHLVFRKAQ
jgi:hypothetical protein